MNLEEKIQWRVLSFTKNKASWNMAVDHAVFEITSEKIGKGEKVKPTIRLYKFSNPAVILGYRQKLNGIDLDMLRSVSGECTTRLTGGGHVYFTTEELHFSIVCPNSMLSSDLAESYRKNNLMIAEALKEIGINAESGRTSVKVDGKTLVVSSQAKNKYATLHHGTIMANIELDFFENILGASAEEKKHLQNTTCLSKLKRNYGNEIGKLHVSIVRNIAGNNPMYQELSDEEFSYAQKLHEEIYRNKRFIGSGKKEAGICIVAGLLREYDTYIKDNTNTVDENG